MVSSFLGGVETQNALWYNAKVNKTPYEGKQKFYLLTHRGVNRLQKWVNKGKTDPKSKQDRVNKR